jgi:hypothetical protein
LSFELTVVSKTGAHETDVNPGPTCAEATNVHVWLPVPAACEVLHPVGAVRSLGAQPAGKLKVSCNCVVVMVPLFFTVALTGRTGVVLFPFPVGTEDHEPLPEGTSTIVPVGGVMTDAAAGPAVTTCTRGTLQAIVVPARTSVRRLIVRDPVDTPEVSEVI